MTEEQIAVVMLDWVLILREVGNCYDLSPEMALRWSTVESVCIVYWFM